MKKDFSDYNPYGPLKSTDRPTALYVHVPFCLRRCGYCDFTLVAEKDSLIPAYLEALQNEFDRLEETFEVETVFIGGGTPTHLASEELQHLFRIIRSKFRWAAGAEISIEANPDGLDQERLRVMSDLGVNRISLGVQSFDDNVLKFLERQHTSAEAVDSVERASRFFDAVSVDLIFGVPEQDESTWKSSLKTATSLPIQHLSTYGLTYERGTSFFRRRLHGQLIPVTDEIERQMYSEAMDHCQKHSFFHYEVSNFAKRPSLAQSGPADHRCRHNLTYWTASPYFAFGPGAARYLDGVRSTNDRNVVRWTNKWLRNEVAVQDVEQLKPEEKAREAIFLGLRRISGFDEKNFSDRFGYSVQELAEIALERHLRAGLIRRDDGRISLTEEGLFVADSVISDFLVPD